MKHAVSRRYLYSSLLAIPLLTATMLLAQDAQAPQTPSAPQAAQPPQSPQAPQNPQDKQQNPPVRGVRLSDAEGGVQILQGTQLLTDQAPPNMTLYEGTRIITADDGRAEVEMDDGSMLRLTPDSSLSFNLLREQGDQTETEIEVNGGLAYFELKHPKDSSGFRVKFGDTLLTATQDSTLRVNLDHAPGSIAVFTGAIHIERPSGLSVDLHAGQYLALDANDAAKYTIAEQIPGDSWDDWNKDRDNELAANASAETPTSQSLSKGSEQAWNDLDANGNWYNVPDVGPVWSPNEAAYAGWDPYGYGSWMWYPQFGYRWVSGYGWGFLPFNAGLWSWYDGFGWGWMPGFGGCDPWFAGGFWGANFGYWPGWYSLPVAPGFAGGHFGGLPPGRRLNGLPPRVIVNRNPVGGRIIRPVSGAVTIAGHSVTPVRSIAPRAIYGRVGPTPGTTRGSYSGAGGYHPASGNSVASGGYGTPRPTTSHSSGGWFNRQPHATSNSNGGYHSGGGGSTHSSGGGFHGGGGFGGGGGGFHGGGGGHH